MGHSIEIQDATRFSADAIERHFARYVAALADRDWGRASALFAADAQGNHAELGPMPPGREGIRAFMEKAPADWALNVVWHRVHGNYAVYKWQHVLPGAIGAGIPPVFYGYCELHYGRDGFDWLMSFPDWAGMKALKQALEKRRA